MIPESSDGLLCHCIVVVTAAVVTEDGKLLLRHHIRRRLSLDTAPDIPNVSFQRLSNGWGDLSVLTGLGYLESVCHRQLIRSVATHFVMIIGSNRGYQIKGYR